MHAEEWGQNEKKELARGSLGKVVLHSVHQRALPLLDACKVEEVRGAVRLCRTDGR